MGDQYADLASSAIMNWIHICLVIVTINITDEHKYRGISSRTVVTKYGVVRGVILDSYSEDLAPIEAFLGIPYAAPPVGPLRFMHPVTPRGWSGVYMADSLRPVCPQKFVSIDESVMGVMSSGYIVTKRLSLKFLQQDEDCLYLNIYAPTADDESSKSKPLVPVMIFIQAESSESSSSSSYEGTILSGVGDVIVVTINFRLGLLGFFTLRDPVARGNYGLMDQIAALHWIKQNIRNFGGDPDKMTVFGHGTGAAFVNLLIASPLTRGLFDRALLQSGSALGPSVVVEDPDRFRDRFLSATDCDRNTSVEVIRCLRHKDLDELLRIDLKQHPVDHVFGPICDGVIIPTNIRDALNSRLGGDPLRLMCGVTKIESSYGFVQDDFKHGIDTGRRDKIIKEFLQKVYKTRSNILSSVIVNEYVDWTKFQQDRLELLQSTLETVSDGQVVAPIFEACSILSRAKGTETYFYVFAHQTSSHNHSSFVGSLHGEELQYIFGEPLKSGGSQWYTHNERDLSELIIKYWTNFARSGNPNAFKKNSKYSRKAQWPTFNENHKKYLSLGVRPRIRQHYRAHKLGIWTGLVPRLSRMFSAEDDRDLSRNATLRVALRETDDSSRKANDGNYAVNLTKISKSHDELESKVFDDQDGDRRRRRPTVWWYSTALSATIAVGCTLCVLNGLVFISMYYRRLKNTRELEKMNSVTSEQLDSETTFTSHHHHQRRQNHKPDCKPQIIQDSVADGKFRISCKNNTKSSFNRNHVINE